MSYYKYNVISHRGNLTGPNTASHGENHPNSINTILEMGYSCEVDVRWVPAEKSYFLGHDKAEFPVEAKFLHNRFLYLHCKDIQTLHKLYLTENTAIRAFFHQKDDMVLITNCKYLWSFPRKEVELTNLSIAVLPELVPNWTNLDRAIGVCTDYVLNYEIET